MYVSIYQRNEYIPGMRGCIQKSARSQLSWVCKRRTCHFDKILGYLRLNRLHLLGLDNLGVALNDNPSGEWGVSRRRNAIAGWRWNGDAVMAWTYERGAAAGSHDADAAAVDPAAVDAATAAAEAARQDGSGLLYIRPSRWDSPPSSFDRQRGLGYDLAYNVAGEVEVGGATAATTLTSKLELVGWMVRQRWGAFNTTCPPPPIMMMTSRCNVA
jgi:hypothetical protein